jgi:hypothetical protein
VSASVTVVRRRFGATALAAWILVLGLLGVVGPTVVWPLVSPVDMLVIAHAGDVVRYPRDTMPAILSAAASNADGIEFDVNRSKDGTWWVVHDSELTADTTGSGSPWDHADAEMARLRIDGGMGFRKAEDGELQPIPRLADVLDHLEGYARLLIVDCKDTRPGAHRALAAYLASRGRYPSIIARHPAGAAEVKSVDPRFRVITQQNETYDQNIDVWLADAGYQLKPPGPTIGDLFGDVGMFIGDSHWGEDERPMLDLGRRWGVSFVITNDVESALRWRGTPNR